MGWKFGWMVALLVGAVPCLPSAVSAVERSTIEIGPDDDWCKRIAALGPGEDLVLGPGEYRAPCTIANSGVAGAPIVIRARDLHNPPRITYPGSRFNLLHIRGSHVVLRGLHFGPTAEGVMAVRVIDGHDITIEDSTFVDLGGSALTVNHATTRNIVVRGNTIIGLNATAIYLGCHDGRFCVVSGVLVEGNYINGVQAGRREIGYGIQVKLNSAAIIRDNIIVNTKGPGIMVYGAADPTQVSLVERNFVTGSRTSSAIVVGGGPAIVRNNIVSSSAEGGIGVEDYGKRGLLRDVVVVHNTVYDNRLGGILVPPMPVQVKVANNVVHARPGTPAFPASRPGVESAGNVDCSLRLCLKDPGAGDFSLTAPAPGAALDGAWAPTDDYFGQPRGLPATAGAVERPNIPIMLGLKPKVATP